jgi:hypothetical protein
VLRTKLARDPPRVRGVHRGVPRNLAAFVDRCLLRDRSRRWTTTNQAYRALHRLTEARRRRRTAVAMLSVSVGAALLARLLLTSAAPGFALLVARPGEEPSVFRSPLYLGPRHATVSLRPVGIEDDDRLQIRCLAAATRTPVPWLTAAWNDAGDIELTGVVFHRREASPLCLELTGTNASPRYSEPFDVVALPDAAGCIQGIEVPGTKGGPGVTGPSTRQNSSCASGSTSNPKTLTGSKSSLAVAPAFLPLRCQRSTGPHSSSCRWAASTRRPAFANSW